MSNGHACRTYYIDLGVSGSATQKEVETALWRWRERVRKGAAGRKELYRAEMAYLTLSDPRRRRAYDRLFVHSDHPAWAGDRSGRAPSAWRLFRKCRGLQKRGKAKSALRMARRAADLDPRCALYRSTLGLLTAQTGGCLHSAVRHCEQAYQLDPGEREIALNLALIYERAGLHKRAARLRRGHARGWRALPERFRHL